MQDTGEHLLPSKNQSKTKRSEKQARIKAWETCRNGIAETKENETKQRETYQHIMMR